MVDFDESRFRWVGCQLASLKKCIAPEDVKNTLRSLPQTLDDTYKRILMDIDERHQRKILVALQWICHACEPVTIEELAEAVIIDPTGAVSFSPRNRIPDPHWLLEILSGLVTISEDCRNLNTMDIGKSVQVVELAHFSVKEYLTSSLILLGPAQKFYIQEESAIEDVLQRSLLYLMSYSVSDMKSASTQDLAEFPLLLYASHYWHHHLLAAEDTISSEMKDLVFDFLNTKTTLLSWLSIYRPDNPFEECFSAESFEIGEPLYYVALWGSCTMVRHIIKWGTSVDAKGREYGSALGAAASNGHTSTVKLLLEAGAKINTYGEEDGFLLETAVAAGDPDHIKFLLEAGADVNAQGGEYGTALHAFSNFGNTEIVAMLLEAGADVNADVEPYGTPIEAALDHDADEHMGVIDLLVAAGADINALDEDELDMLRWYRDSGSK
jgi:ankyrin repeat protein